MRRILLSLSTVLTLAGLAVPAEAQFKLGLQGAVITGVDDLGAVSPGAPDFAGMFGVGARATLFQEPEVPVGAVLQGARYSTDVDDYDYRSYSIALMRRLSTPVLDLYALGGWQWRQTIIQGESQTKDGVMIGAGVEINFATVALFVEGTYEFHENLDQMPDFDNDPFVIKGGVMFGF